MSKHPMMFRPGRYNERIDYVGDMKPFGVGAHRKPEGYAQPAFPKGVNPAKLPDGRNY